MSFVDKLKFWKKEDSFDFDDLAHKEMGKDDPFNTKLSTETGPDPFAEPNLHSATPVGSHQPTTIHDPLAPKSFSQPAGAAMRHPSSGQVAQFTLTKRDIELLNSKLDTIKAVLQSLDQRVARFEQPNAQQQQQKLW